MKARSLALLAVAIAVALVAAGCGGASDTAGGGSSSSGSAGGGAKTQLSLVAYSTPQVVYDEVIPAFQKTAAGKGVAFKQSYGASGDQSRAVEAGLPADVVAFSLAPDMTASSRPASSPTTGTSTPTKGFVIDVGRRSSSSARATRRTSRPGTTCSSRASRSLTPNPFTSGAREVEPPGRLRRQERAAARRAGRPRLPARADHQARQGPGQVRPRGAADLHSAATATCCISYENEAITAQQKGQDVDYVIPDQTILIENPIAVTRRPSTPRRPRRSSTTRCRTPARRRFAELGLPPGRPGGLRREQGEVPDAEAACSRSTTSAAGQGQRRVLRPGQGLGRQDRGGRGGLHCQVSAPRALPGRRGAARAPRAARAARGARRSASRRCG